MALAILQSVVQKNGKYQFKADIGTNQFYQYRIGKRKKKYKGIDQLEQVSFRSQVLSDLNRASKMLRTPFVLEIPFQHFDRENDKIQLVSFKNKKGAGIAFSNVIRVLPKLRTNEEPFFPNLTLSLENTTMESTIVKHKAFNYHEPGVSKTMFWGTIVNALPGILKVATPIIGGLLKKGNSGGGGTAKTDSSKDDILNAIIELLGNIKGGETAVPAAQSLGTHTVVKPDTLIKLIPFLEKTFSPETIQAIGDDPKKLIKAIGEAAKKIGSKQVENINSKKANFSKKTNGQLSEAKVAPALLAALPALAGVAEKALNPDLIKAIGGFLLNAANQDNQLLKDLNPGVDKINIDALLASMSMSAPEFHTLKFKVNTKLNLEFVNTTLVKLNGKNRLVYSKNSDLHFPFKISAEGENIPQRVISKVMVQLICKDSDTDEMLLEKKFKLKDVNLGNTIEHVIITSEEASSLPSNKDIKMDLSFVWKGKKSKQNIGIFKIHHFSLVSEYLFDRLGEAVTAPVPLNDVVKYRPFWHKVWEGGFSKSKRWEIDLDVKYYYALDIHEKAISKLETKRKIENDNANDGKHPRRRKVEAKIKSGLEVSIPALNNILTSFSKPTLNEAQLDALRSEKLKKFYNQVARINVDIGGWSGDTGTLWTYPEMAIHKIHLVRPANINGLGQVTALTEEVVEFPRPTIIHFIATKSE